MPTAAIEDQRSFSLTMVRLIYQGGANQYGYCDYNTLKLGTAAHWVARLERDAPTDPQAARLLEQVRAKLITANAAAVLMGWRKPPNPACA
jgi:hypothetical protein